VFVIRIDFDIGFHWSLDKWITHVSMERSSTYRAELNTFNERVDYLLPQLPIASSKRGDIKSSIIVRLKLEV
jgi:hypothetical protein